jgi:subtilisin family serine protease
MKKIFTISGEQYMPVSSGKNYIFRQYESVYSFLKRNFKEEISAVLCKPIQSGESVVFYTDKQGDFRPIDELTIEQKQQLLIHYNSLVHTIHLKCKIYKLSNDIDSANWAETLTMVFDHDSNMLFSDGKDLVIVWGWKFRLKSANYLPFEAFSNALAYDEGQVETNEMANEHVNENSEISMEEEHAVEPEIDLNQDDETIIQSYSDDVEEEVEEIREPEPQSTIPPILDQSKTPVIKEKHWFLKLLDAIERFAKRFWWLLIILLCIILFLFVRGCDNKPFKGSELPIEEQDKLYSEIMPDQPRQRILPIDTTKFIDDEESYSRIIGDVVNIALKNKSQNFKHFVIDLKHEFDEDEYKVIYFDDETSRLQFTFPEEERTNIKDKIKTSMASYDLLIWDETIFESSKTMNDPDFKSADKAWFFKSINAEKAWDITTGDTSVILAIIDDGFDLDHVELRNKIVKRYNIVDDNTRIFSGPDRFHGTHVAGIAVADGNNKKGLCGIAPGCRIMPIQAAGEDGFFTMTDIIDGILYAIKNGADVINMSLGKQFSDNIEFLSPGQMEDIANQSGIDEAKFWKELFQIAEDNNVTIVLAGGNQNIMVGLDPMQRSSQVIKVAATDKSDSKAVFSNFFRKSESDCYISAPGVKIYSTFPGNSYGFLDGTSMASPVVAGSICLMKSVNPRLTNAQIRKILRSTSKPLNDRRLAPLIQVDKVVRKARSL